MGGQDREKVKSRDKGHRPHTGTRPAGLSRQHSVHGEAVMLEDFRNGPRVPPCSSGLRSPGLAPLITGCLDLPERRGRPHALSCFTCVVNDSVLLVGILAGFRSQATGTNPSRFMRAGTSHQPNTITKHNLRRRRMLHHHRS